MGRCRICGSESRLISSSLEVCGECLKKYPSKALSIARDSRRSLGFRRRLGLPVHPPKDPNGVTCRLCVNECSIPEGGVGFCGLWRAEEGLLRSVAGERKALVTWYLDPHPTNCVAEPFCPATSGVGYPRFAVRDGLERGYYNLAVFFGGCGLDCLFCQNWEHKIMVSNAISGRLSRDSVRSVDDLVEAAMNPKVTCVCYFGGDPGPHAPYALEVSRAIIEESRKHGAVKRICWETNGLEHPGIMEAMAKQSLITGGIVKIDWKAWTPSIYEALTGVDGHKAIERLKKNAATVARIGMERSEIPLLTVSILLVPGYVTPEEVRSIAEYLASLNVEVPVVLLAFHPDHLMRDLPPTPRTLAEEAVKEARNAGIKRVYVGNIWLLM